MSLLIIIEIIFLNIIFYIVRLLEFLCVKLRN